jgi:hypothetical protein
MKQTIEEAAKDQLYWNYRCESNAEYDSIEVRLDAVKRDMVEFAKSNFVKDFHIQGMYSEEEVLNIAGQVFAMTTLNNCEDPYPLFIQWFRDYKKKKNGTT